MTRGCASTRSRSNGGAASSKPAGSRPTVISSSGCGRPTNSVGGASLDVYGAPYGSDLRLLTGQGGIPTVQYGPGDAKLAHGPFESVAVDQVLTTARTLAALDRRHLRRRLKRWRCCVIGTTVGDWGPTVDRRSQTSLV